MSAPHTPGPWEAEPKGGKGSWIKGANGEWAALSCGDSDETADANARLIAAAPDLLAALEALEHEYGPTTTAHTHDRASRRGRDYPASADQRSHRRIYSKARWKGSILSLGQ